MVSTAHDCDTVYMYMYMTCTCHAQSELEELATAEARSKVEKFLATEKSIVTRPVDAFASQTAEGEGAIAVIELAHSLFELGISELAFRCLYATHTGPSISNMAGLEAGTTHIPPSSSSAAATTTTATSSDGGEEGGKGKRPKLPSFWIPTLTPNAKPTEIKKPVRLYTYTYTLYIRSEIDSLPPSVPPSISLPLSLPQSPSLCPSLCPSLNLPPSVPPSISLPLSLPQSPSLCPSLCPSPNLPPSIPPSVPPSIPPSVPLSPSSLFLYFPYYCCQDMKTYCPMSGKQLRVKVQ